MSGLTIVLLGSGLSLVLILGFSFYAGLKITQRREPDLATTPLEHGMDFEVVNFASSDGIPLVGWWIPAKVSNQPIIVMCHGQNGSMDGDVHQAKMLHEANFNVLMFDMRGHGQSGGKYVTMGIREVLDLRAVLNFVHQNYQTQPIGVLGLSMGALVAIRGASEASSYIKCLVLDGTTGDIHVTMTRWLTEKHIPKFVVKPFMWLALRLAAIYSDTPIHHVDPARWIGQVRDCPMFFIHSEHDEFVDLSVIQNLQSLTEEPTDLWIVSDCKHREAYAKHPVDYQERVVGWFRGNL